MEQLNRLQLQDVPASLWATLHPGLLNQIFALVPLDSGLACENICTVWRRIHIKAFVCARRGSSLVFLDAKAKRAKSQAANARTRQRCCYDNHDRHLEACRQPGHVVVRKDVALSTIWFGTSQQPTDLSIYTWQRLLTTFVLGTLELQLNLAVPGKGFYRIM